MIREAVIPAAGYGTRVSPASRAVPKELFPIPIRIGYRKLYLVPALQIILQQLYEAGIDSFYIIVNHYKKTIIEGYLRPDYNYLYTLIGNGKLGEASLLNKFYGILDRIRISYIIQERPLGVGDAIYRSRDHVEGQFMIHMGDDLIISSHNEYLRMIKEHTRLGSDATILVQMVDNPRQYGVVEGDEEDNYIWVNKIIEKPDVDTPKYAIIGVYCIKPVIFEVMESLSRRGEWELTDAVQEMVDQGYKVVAIKASPGAARIDIGRPETYLEVFRKPIQLW